MHLTYIKHVVTMQQRIVVIGAGAVGLSTAVQIQHTVPKNVSVTIMADKFTTETTSHGAAGMFRPTLSKTPKVPIALLKTWLSDSWKHYDSLAHSAEAGLSGVQIISGYQFIEDPQKNELESDFVYQYRPLTNKELSMFPGDRFKHGWFITTLLVDPAKYLPYLMERFLSKGGKVIERQLTSFEELVGQYDLVVNCTGLGSKELLGDQELVPNRGHLVKVKAPWIKHFVLVGKEGLCYIYPGNDVVHIGGTRADHDLDPSPRVADRDRILADAYRILPSLKNATHVMDWVGWRPHRAPLRVEEEVRQYPAGRLQMVHNYGHGAEGISLSWGTGTHAARLVSKLLREESLTSKL